MKIERIQLDQFRGFAELDFEPEPDITVLVGTNGAGKSSVLDAIRIALAPIAWIVRGAPPEQSLSMHDIRAGADAASVDVSATMGAPGVWWRLRRQRFGDQHDTVHELAQALLYGLSVREGIAAGRPSLPCAIHYASNRRVVDVPESMQRRPPIDLLELGPPTPAAYRGALDATTNFRGFFEWYREEEDVYNERRLRGTAATRTDRREPLDIVRGSIEALFPTGTNLRIERRPSERMLIDVHGVTLEIEQLSDGEKGLLSIVGDLARRMVLADAVSNDPLSQEAVVLIDEIELHLHPGLQRTILPRLRRVFPRTQFIVTTHSPQVLSSVHARNVRLLQDFKVVPLERETWRRDTNRILESVFGDPGRPPEIARKLNDLRNAVDDDRVDEARRLIAELRAELEGDDPDIVFYEQLLPPITDAAAQ